MAKTSLPARLLPKPELRPKPKLSTNQLDTLQRQRDSISQITDGEKQARESQVNRITLFLAQQDNDSQATNLPVEVEVEKEPLLHSSKSEQKPIVVDEASLEDPLYSVLTLKRSVHPRNSLLKTWRQSLDQWQERTMNMPSVSLALGFIQRLGYCLQIHVCPSSVHF